MDELQDNTAALTHAIPEAAMSVSDSHEEAREMDNHDDPLPAPGARTVKATLTGEEFEVNGNGVFLLEGPRKKTPICGKLRIIGDARDIDNRNWNKMVLFKDFDQHEHTLFLRMEDLNGDGVISQLRSMGLTVSPDRRAREKLMIYLQDCPPEESNRFRLTNKTGWHDGYYVLPDGRSFGAGRERYVYQQLGSGEQPFRSSGSLDDWKEHVARLCRGNSRLLFAVSMAFAAPLIDLVKSESGGFNLVGTSSTGKSTALHVASSVGGIPSTYIQSWRATTNGLEGTALRYNDSLLPLDELGQIDAKEAGAAAYMLSNGQGKKRASATGDARPRYSWRVLLLSSGEITLGDHMHEAGKMVRAGQEIRLADIPADAGAGHGLFEDLHGYPNGAAFSEVLKKNAAFYHGSALPRYLEAVVSDQDALLNGFIQVKDIFLREFVPAGASGQVLRLADRFALIVAAGKYATHIGLTGWEEEDVYSAAGTCYRAWLAARGGSEQQEVTTLLRQVRQFFEQYGESRFSKMHDIGLGPTVFTNNRTNNRAGFSRATEEAKHRQAGYEYFVLPESFREICKGHNPTWAAKVLVQHGYIRPDSEGKPQSPHRLPTIGMKRVYHFTTKVLADSEGVPGRG